MTTPVPAAIAILALLVVLALMLASLLSAGERAQAEIWRQQWAASSVAVRQLTLDTTAARGERDRARATAVVLEQQLAQIVRLADITLLVAQDDEDAGLAGFALAVMEIAHDLRDDEEVGLR